MRSFRKFKTGAATGLLIGLTITAKAEAPSWLQWLPSSSPAINVLYRMVPSLAGSVNVRRPPKETAPQLVVVSSRTPSDTDLIKISAREYEAALDFSNAEARWKLLESVSPDHVANQIELADYYHRRMQPQSELEALKAAAEQAPAINDPLQPDVQQRAWKLHERAQQLIHDEAMSADLGIQDYERWMAKYPRSAALQRQYFEFLLRNSTPARAEQALTQYQQNFPNDRVSIVRAKIELAQKRGSPGGAIAVFDASYDPLWPKELLDSYFKLLADSHTSFEFYQNARKAAVAKPLDLDPATRLFHYYRGQSDVAAAKRELAEFRVRKEAAKASWSVTELRTLAKLSAAVDDYEEAIRYAYALYSLKGVDDASAEEALAQIIDVLLKAPDQPIRFGKGDLSFYRDIATMDSSPGFLNGILSLIFNSQYPDQQFRNQERKSQSYFHRAKAAELYALLTQRFPNSTHRSELLSRLIESYALYGEDDAIIRQGTAFIEDFPNAEQRTKVALQVADAYARAKRTNDELAIYNRLLGELAAKAQQVPLGGGQQPRSPEYSQVLQRYVARLGQLNQIPAALALYRAEIDRNPNDPGLYDALVAYLGAHQRAGEVEQVYRQALQHFPDASWRHKLARYYLRSRMSNELQTLSRQVIDTFNGSDVEAYLSDVGTDPNFERRLQVDINVYALNRFPNDLRFVHNLTSLYSTVPTANPPALMRLLAEHWYEDEAIRRMYFERLAATGSLSPVVQNAASLLPASSASSWPAAEAANPLVTRFLGEAAAWQSHFETASTILQAVAAAYPADAAFAGRASELYRSLAAYDRNYATTSVAIAEDLYRAEPRNRERLTRIGEIYADHDMAAPAATVWSRIPTIEPGKADSYLETATVFWDYLRPADALDWLRKGRTQMKDPTLWSYETAAILESQGQRQAAVTEYLRGALGTNGSQSQARLVKLAVRNNYKSLIDDQLKRRMDASPADSGILQLRIRILRAQKRDAELEPLLTQTVTRTSSHEMLSYIGRVADEAGMRTVQERVLRRQAQLESDPEEKLRLGLQLAHFLEDIGDNNAARVQIESVYQANSLIAGVIRATADYYWRHDKPQAIRVLATAAEKAHPSLKRDYYVETIRKAIDAKQPADAVQSAQQLLSLDPLNGQSVALMADALSANGRQAELQQLYASKISEIQQSSLSAADKTDRIAAMRRGLIPVLDRENKFREANDQYIEIINKFPDDSGLVSEAAKHASQHNLQAQLIDYYSRTSTNSPRDPRWFIVLARLQVAFENYPAAIDAYSKAMVARPERQDLAIARADLEERSFRFSEAIATYNRLYELSHQNPTFMEHIARLQARLGQTTEVIASLRKAYIENRPDAARDFTKVASILEELGMFDTAADYAKQATLISDGVYVVMMTKAYRVDEALQRALTVQNSMVGTELGNTVATYYTPEQKQAFAALLTQRHQNATNPGKQSLISIANAAGLYDLEVGWRVDQAVPEFTFEPLQGDRVRFIELAHQLEALADKRQPQQRLSLLQSAARYYETMGATADELGLFSRRPELQVNERRRYFALLAGQRPDDLLRLAGDPATDASHLLAIQTFIDVGDDVRAIQAIRAQKRDAVWVNAYSGLTGIYFAVKSPDISSAFQQALGSPLIQDRLSQRLDRSKQMAGNVWFYYGQRYGEYLRDLDNRQDADDYLWSVVEAHPGEAGAYLELARYDQGIAETDRAIAEFRHALDLNNKRPDIHSEMAVALWDAGRHDEALAEWNVALKQLTDQPDYGAGLRVFRDIRAKQQDAPLHTAMDSALRAAARTPLVWQLPALLQAAFENSSDDRWFMDIVQASREPAQILTTLANGGSRSWLSKQQYKTVLETAYTILSSSTALGREQFQQVRQEYLNFLIEERDTAAAKKLMDTFSEAERRSDSFHQAEIRLAALDNTLTDLLSRYQEDPAAGASDYELQQTVVVLEHFGFADAAQQVQVFQYSRQIEKSVNPPAYLGLAEIRVKQGQVDEAVTLLKRLNQLSATPFENLLASGRVFLSTGRPVQAEEFLKLRVQAVPWDYEGRLELGRAELALNQNVPAASDLEKVMNAADASYDIRTQAARELGKNRLASSRSSGVRELDLLSNRVPLTPDNADAPYFVAARLTAAETTNDETVRVRLLLGAIAEQPRNSVIRQQLLKAALAARQYHVALAAYAANGFAVQNDPEIAAGVAEAQRQLGEFAEAAQMFAGAATNVRDDAQRQALQEKAKQAQAENSKRAENERRRPVIRADLDQPNPVRRRLP